MLWSPVDADKFVKRFAAVVALAACAAAANAGPREQAKRMHDRIAGVPPTNSVLGAMEAAIGDGPWLLGERFTMADVIFGGTIRWMLRTGALEQRPVFGAYAERLGARPAVQAADAKNAAVIAERGLTRA